MSLETFRLSTAEKDMLILIKRRTGLKTWNVPCRWALCLSLAESTEPPETPIGSDSNLEMNWKTFAGPNAEIYRGLISQRCTQRNEASDDPSHLAKVFRLHLRRGLGYIIGRDDCKNLTGLISTALP